MGVNNGSRVANGAPRSGGALWIAPEGTTLPTDASATLPVAAVCLGPISDEGIKPGGDTNTEEVREMDGSTLAELLTDESRSFEATMLGFLDEDALEFVYGAGNVTITPPTTTVGTKIAVADKGGQLPKCVMFIETAYGLKKIRDVGPVCQPTITDRNAITKGGLRGWTARFSLQKDSSGSFSYTYSVLDDATG
ncbi:hypothetical protein [Luteipulveratus mongoliensis]|uniref:Tail protein n=1 Tax=Luteipulveratus mongoliensis TaxID=571913 RepID=A0A0K1JGC2_9MICO|nr:hypothetical protein [Luteipulveratus mongoliensis]AKU15746.1 hypothetical protein VV02_07595 [Luteipulveratus mongoliensis]